MREVNTPRIYFTYPASLNPTIAVRLIGVTLVVIKLISNPMFSQSSPERSHRKGWGWQQMTNHKHGQV